MYDAAGVRVSHRAVLFLLALPVLAIVIFISYEVTKSERGQTVEVIAITEPRSFWSRTLSPAKGVIASEATIRLMMMSAEKLEPERSALRGARHVTAFYGVRDSDFRPVYSLTGENRIPCASRQGNDVCYWAIEVDAQAREP